MENQTKQVAIQFLTAVQQGDNQTLAALLDEHIEWEQPGNNRFSGFKSDITQVFQMVGGMFEHTGNTLQLSAIKDIAVSGNSVACLIQWKAQRPDGGTLDVHNIDVYTVTAGKIVKAKVYTCDPTQEDLFWGK
ncbi:nuclear transport factor 2 family protein [Chitinophaga rhizophila]|uniref:Nuclear transport factor 2 family protein n=1 Tax=Chitinophaga rhizophila TaxID=2866212 RepID=A0ABS7GIF9_9BACT|nr:nuclear transport factor 2 family protein [Chitinophaga rhizophila]MBW8686462.1 nuclear transport factor 2 family protein [Chitinophaga rhizophila]